MPYNPGLGKTEAFPRESIDEYKLDFYTSITYNLTPQEARRQIAYKLREKNLIISTQPVKKSELDAIIGSTFNENFLSSMIHGGMVWVQANVDNTNNTGEIKAGQPVVFDSVSGRAVTGINSLWGEEEYRIIGIAWKDHTNFFKKQIPIMLTPDIREVKNYGGKMYEQLDFEDEARVIVYTPDYTLNDIIPMKDPAQFPGGQPKLIMAKDWFLKQAGKFLPTGTNVSISKWGSSWRVDQAKC